MTRVLCPAAAVICILLFPLPGITQPNSGTQQTSGLQVRLHEDARCGFRVRYPAEWQESWRPEGNTEARFRIAPPNEPDIYVEIRGIWDVSAIGRYPASVSGDRSPGGEARAMGTLAEVLLSDRRLPGELVWFDELRGGQIAISYVMQLLDGDMYHFSFLLVSSGTARGINADGWSYSVIGAWVPQPKVREVGPLVMGIVKSVEFIKPGEACWR